MTPTPRGHEITRGNRLRVAITACLIVVGGLGWFAPSGWARPAQIILLRHGEKPAKRSDLHLSPRGRERARALVSLFTTNSIFLTNGLPVALFAPQVTRHGHGLRPYETLEPLAKALRLPIHTPFPPEDTGSLARQVLKDPAFTGKTIVICWVHDYLAELAKKLGVKPKPRPWNGQSYDRVWLISYEGSRATLRSVPQHLLPGDSPD